MESYERDLPEVVWGEDAAPVRTDEREVPQMLGRMATALEELNKEIAALDEILQPVLRDSEPSSEKAMTVPREDPLTDMGRALDVQASSVQDASARLRGLRSRVEL